MIKVDKLTKRYGTFTAIDSLSFEAKHGEVLGFLGPNGAGKTTTMRILTGFMPPTEGRATVAGYDVFTESMQVRQVVGYLPETVPLYPDMSVRGYLGFMAELRRVKDRQDRVWEVLERVDMLDRSESLIRNLSKGLRQRVGLAQAIIHDPPVLILDEPAIGLDPRQVLAVRRLVRELGEDHTVMFSTHILSEAEQLCDRVLIIHQGHAIAEGPPESLRDQLQRTGRMFVRVGGTADPLALLETVPGVASVEEVEAGYAVTSASAEDVRPAIAKTVVQAGQELLELRPLAMTLEDIFLEVTHVEEPDDEVVVSEEVPEVAVQVVPTEEDEEAKDE